MLQDHDDPSACCCMQHTQPHSFVQVMPDYVLHTKEKADIEQMIAKAKRTRTVRVGAVGCQDSGCTSEICQAAVQLQRASPFLDFHNARTLAWAEHQLRHMSMQVQRHCYVVQNSIPSGFTYVPALVPKLHRGIDVGAAPLPLPSPCMCCCWFTVGLDRFSIPCIDRQCQSQR